MSGKTLSFLDLVATCDNFLDVQEDLVPWRVSPGGTAIGLLRSPIVEQLISENQRSQERGLEESWFIERDGTRVLEISFASGIINTKKRSTVVKELCERWRDEGFFSDIIGPRVWRSELYPVYLDPLGPHYIAEPTSSAGDDSNHAFDIERAAAALFGVVTYGIHMTIYEETENGQVRIWVPQRAKTKQTWPGYLDNSVAGGIPSGMAVFESLVKESMEEASIKEEVVRSHARAVGSVSYFYRTKKGWLQPEVEYVYDLRIPPGVDPTPFQPKPLDGEVESFELLTLEEVIPRMKTGLFKANCAAVLVDFMIRHGFITPDNEPRYMEIITRLHRQFDLEFSSRRK